MIMEAYIPFAFLNDFIFCPRSIYYHNLYGSFNDQMYKGTAQTEGTLAHHTIDTQKYSTSKGVLQGMEVYCHQYKLMGKIDIYDSKKKALIERKNHINQIHIGYKFQLFAQYYALIEMNYEIESMFLYDMSKNIKHLVLLPEDDLIGFIQFEVCIENLINYSLLNSAFEANPEKCKKCIYYLLCDKAAC